MPHIDTALRESGITCSRREGGEVELAVPSRVGGAYGKEAVGHWHGWELLNTHAWSIPTELTTILGQLREGDRIRLCWWPDAETTATLAEHGLHADLIRLEVDRGGEVSIHRLAARVVEADNIMRLVKPGLGGKA